MHTPSNFHLWNRAHQGAYRKGYAVGVSGVAREDAECPYQDHRKPSGRLSWSRSFITAWHDGHHEGYLQFCITQGAGNRCNYPIPRA